VRREVHRDDSDRGINGDTQLLERIVHHNDGSWLGLDSLLEFTGPQGLKARTRCEWEHRDSTAIVTMSMSRAEHRTLIERLRTNVIC
jgi:hypothetical protein